MSDLREIDYLRRQKAELNALLSEAVSTSDVVAKMNYQSRLDVVTEELVAAERQDARVAQVSVLFDGGPVDGTSSINAGFAAQALLNFQGIVTRLYSSSLRGQLSAKGTIRGADLAQLNLRGIATGSFGFVLEESNSDQSSAINTPLREAVQDAADLFSEFSQEDDDEFLVDVDEINPRVFNALAKFFRHLEKNEATLKTNLPDASYSFDRAGIQRAFERISASQVSIVEETWVGTLVGLTPIKRAFEFRKNGDVAVVSGKFSQQVSQDYLERIERQDGITLGATFRATIEIGALRKPDGTISTTYTVTNLEDIEED